MAVVINEIPFPDDELAGEERNLALGRFMTAWSQIEVICRYLLQEAIGGDDDRTNVVFDNIGTREQLSILSGLVPHLRVDPDAHEEDDALSQLLQEAQELSVARNRIVHARWGSLHGESARFHFGLTDRQIAEVALNTERSSKFRARIYTVADLTEATERCIRVRDGLVTRNDGFHPQRIAAMLQRAQFHSVSSRDAEDS